MSGIVKKRQAQDESKSHTQRLLQKLKLGQRANLVVLGDSTGDSVDEWVYLVGAKIAGIFKSATVTYRAWSGEEFAAAVTIQAGSGGGILEIWNASIAGAVQNRFLGNIEAAIDPAAMVGEADLVLVSYGHNGGLDLERQVPAMGALLGELSRAAPFCPVIVIGQNPVTIDDSMAVKVDAFRSLAVAAGAGWIDVHEHFKSNAVPLTDFYVDTVHPNAAGSELWARVVGGAFGEVKSGKSGAAKSTTARGVLVAIDSFTAFSKWTLTGGILVEKDSIEFETRGVSARLTGTGAGSAYISKDVISSADIRAYRGRWVTVTARVRVPDGAGVDAGRIALYDGVTTVLTANGGPKGSRWVTQAISMKVGAAATYVRAYVYLSTSAPTTDVIHIDRLTVADGAFPKDADTPKEIESVGGVRVLGAKAEGVLIVRNQSNGGRAVQVLATTGGSDEDDPATQYTAALHSGGFSGKARSDAFDRVQINGQTGTIFFGLGTAVPTVGLSSGGAELLRVLSAHFYNNVDDLFDLGLVGRRWRRGYVKELRPGAGSVIWSSGGGSPEGVVSAPIGSMFTRTDGGAGTTLYVKESGAAAVGWVAK